MREYPKEYKIESVKLYLANGRQKNKTARDLGVPLTTLRGLIKKYMSEAIDKSKEKPKKRDYEKELKEKQKIIEQQQEEILILKKSIGIFTRDSQKK